MKLGAVIKGADRFVLKGIPVAAWAKVATEVAQWKRDDLSRQPALKVRTGQLRDSIIARAVKARGKDIRRWKVLPDGKRTRPNPKPTTNVFGRSRVKKNAFKKAKSLTLRHYDLMFYQVQRQKRKFMALTETQRRGIKTLFAKGLFNAIKRNEVRLDKKGRVTKI